MLRRFTLALMSWIVLAALGSIAGLSLVSGARASIVILDSTSSSIDWNIGSCRFQAATYVNFNHIGGSNYYGGYIKEFQGGAAAGGALVDSTGTVSTATPFSEQYLVSTCGVSNVTDLSQAYQTTTMTGTLEFSYVYQGAPYHLFVTVDNYFGAHATLTNLATPPSVSLVVSPTTVAKLGIATLTYTIDNTADGAVDVTIPGYIIPVLNGVNFMTALGYSTTCTGTIAFPVASRIVLTGGRLAAGSSCTIKAYVGSSTSGAKTISPGILTLGEFPYTVSGTSRTLTVTSATARQGPSTYVALSSSGIAIGGTSIVTITLDNSATNAIALTGVTANVTLPANVTVASVANASTTCAAGSVAASGSSIALSGATMDLGATCTFQATVTSSTAGVYSIPTGSAFGAATSKGGGGAPANLTVTAAPSLATTQAVPTTTATAGTAVTAFTPVTATGGTGTLAYALSGGTLPTGLTFSTTTGQISGTPSTLLAATTFTVTVTDQTTPTAQTSAKTFSLTVTAPILTTTQGSPSTTITATAGTALTAFSPVTATGGFGTLTYALSGGALPTGLTFSTTTGQISGTPTTLLAATTFTVTVTDSATPTAQTSAQTFSLAVNAATLATTQAVAATTATSGTAVTAFTPVTTSGGFGTLSYALSGGTLPAGLTFSTTTGQISGTPTALLAATTFTVTVTDQTTPTAQTSSKTFSLTVNAATLVTTQAVPITGGTSGSELPAFTPVTGTGGFGALSYALTGGTLPTGLTFSTSTGQISGTPTTVLAATTFTVTVTDHTTPSAQTSSKTFSLTINPPGLSTTQAVPATTLAAGTAVTPFTPVTSSGGTGTIAFALSGGTLPAGLAFSTTTGQISGKPTAPQATTTFTVTVTDSATPAAQTSSKTFQLTVTVGTPASLTIASGNAQSATVGTAFGTALSVIVKDASGNLVSGASVTFAAPTSGASGIFAGAATVVSNAAGVATAPAFTANAVAGAFTVTASVAGVTTPASFNLTNAAGAPTAAIVTSGNNLTTPVNSTFGQRLSVTVTDANGNPLAGINVTFSAPTSGAGGTFTATSQNAGLVPPSIRQRVLAAGFLATGGTQLALASSGTSTIIVPTNAQGVASVNFAANSTSGSYAVVATVAGGGATTFTLTNAKSGNTITFNPLGSVLQGAGPVALVATATSGNTVVFTSLTPSVCTVSGASAILVPGASGTCTIAANDPGNATYQAATQVTQSFTINTRPDPSRDTEVIGLITAQTQAAKQFADIQIRNFNSRLEQMHGDGYVSNSYGIALIDGLRQDPDELKSFSDTDPLLKHSDSALNATNRALSKVDREKRSQDRTIAGKERAASLDRAFAFWTAGAIQVGRVHNNNTATSTDLTTAGISAGVDYRVSQFLSIGFGLGYATTTAEIGDNGTRTTGRNYDAVLYSSIRPTSASFIDVLGGASILDFSSSRYITGGMGAATGKRSGYEFFGSVTTGVDFKTKQYTLTPYARVDGKTGTLNAFDENAPTSWALHYDKETFSTASIDIGLKAAVKLRNELEFVHPYFRAEFQHDIINNASAGVTYVDLVGTGTSYSVALPGSNTNRIMLGLGTDMTIEDFKITLEYLNAFSTSSSSDASMIRAKVAKQF